MGSENAKARADARLCLRPDYVGSILPGPRRSRILVLRQSIRNPRGENRGDARNDQIGDTVSIPAASLGRIPNANSLRQIQRRTSVASTIDCPCPDYLDEVAAQEWERVLPLLQGTITEKDLAIVAAYSQAYSDWLQASANAAKEPKVLTTPNGALQTSPYWTQMRQAREDFTKLAAHLGLTPASRLRMNVPDASANLPFVQ